MITEKDEELFEDNPFDYVRKDIEGSDQETRRRSAIDLVRALLKIFMIKTSQLCCNYVDVLMQQYQSTGNWKLKDAALHLILSVSIMTTSNTLGANDLNPNVNVADMFNKYILPELSEVNTLNSKPLLKSDVIKLICLFRNHLDINQLTTLIFPLLVQYLNAKYIVIQTYASMTIEKCLALKYKDSNNQLVLKLTKQHVNAYIQPLFGNLFNILESNPNNAENDYVMKCIMRVLLVIGTDMLTALELISNKLTSILVRVCKNPINPMFNHYLFECIAVMVRIGCEESNEVNKSLCVSNGTLFEQLLFPSFQSVLVENVTVFIPYVFQIFAQLLYYRPSECGGLSDAYKALFPPLLSPALWECKGNIPALTELFQAYIVRGMKDIVTGGHLMGVLGIFQKLLASKVGNTIYKHFIH